ncbi:XRE family transcriptional regulator [soil metagenome]
MAVRVPIEGPTLEWAREALHLDRDEVGRAAGVSAERIGEFETGDTKPTIVQLRKIAHKLDRPLAYFFTPIPDVSDVPETADFRARAGDELPPKLLREMKRADAQRATMLDLVGASVDQLDLGAVDWNNVESRASELRALFGLSETFRPPENREGEVFKFWRGLLEANGVLVFQTTGVPLSAFRGLSISHDVLPIILLNGADSNNGKTFTLFHEIAHLANRTSGVCVLSEDVREEALCNAFAADTLMPKDAVTAVVRSIKDRVQWPAAIALRFRVSDLAAGVRLKTLGFISDEELLRIREESDARWDRVRQLQRDDDSSFVPPWRLRYRDLGPSYMRAVFTALDADRINYLDASYLLNARLPTLTQMQSEFYRTGGK